MSNSAVVPQGMTGSIGRAHRRTAWWTAALLASLTVAIGCSEKKETDSEYLLRFPEPNKGAYTIQVGNSEPQPVPRGSLRARVFVAGGPVTEIVVTVKLDGGGSCMAVVMVDGPGPYDVILDCGNVPLDASPVVAMPDAGADTGADATPDLMADTGPSEGCREYCRVMGTRCPSVYRGESDCLATCTAFGWPTGTVGVAGNTIGCRIGQAMISSAVDNVDTCFRAGPSGGNVCGLLCPNYCQAVAQTGCEGVIVDPAVCPTCQSQVPVPAELVSDKGATPSCHIYWLGEAIKDGGNTCPRLRPGAADAPCRP